MTQILSDCTTCGQTYGVIFGVRKGKYTRFTVCRCDKKMYRAAQTIKELRRRIRVLAGTAKVAANKLGVYPLVPCAYCERIIHSRDTVPYCNAVCMSLHGVPS